MGDGGSYGGGHRPRAARRAARDSVPRPAAGGG
jgi:hypothetical protein